MKQRRLIDTNLIVRHLVQDHAEHAKIASALFEACDNGQFILVIVPEVLAECVFVLESFYKHTRADIATSLTQLIECPNIEIAENTIHSDALDRYARSKLHFVDCVVAATGAARKFSVASFDTDFKKMPDVSVDLSFK